MNTGKTKQRDCSPPADRPERAPRGFEWLPDAYHRDVEPLGDEALEKIGEALAEGDVEVILRSPHGERKPVPDRMWDKDEVERKVYRRFEDGWMRAKYGPDKVPFCGWIFVEKNTWAKAVATPSQRRTPARFSENAVRAMFRGYIKEIEDNNKPVPKREHDVKAVREHFERDIPKHFIFKLRSELAPDRWKKPGPKSSV
jgi:hypothetical protein